MNDHVTSTIEHFTADERLRALHDLLRVLPPSAIRNALSLLESETEIIYTGEQISSELKEFVAECNHNDHIPQSAISAAQRLLSKYGWLG